MRPDKTTAAGWARPDGADRYHYFAGPRSLCRAVVLIAGETMEPGEPGASCGECRAVIRGWLRSKEGA